MSREPDAEGGPELGDGPPPDEFDAIVSAWRLEGQVPAWPDERDATPYGEADPAPVEEPVTPEPPTPKPAAPEPERPTDAAPTPPGPTPWTTAGTTAAPLDEHFVPPEPPPLPRLGPPALVGLALLGLGLVLLVAPGWVGVPGPYGLPLGLITLASGLGWLVLRLWPDPPSDDHDSDDDGAVI